MNKNIKRGWDERKCRICGRTRYLYELEFAPEETECEEEFSVDVCGMCWDIIATIAQRVVKGVVEVAVKENMQ